LAEESLKMTELYSNYGSKAVETLEEYKKINGKKQPKRKKNKGIKINKYKNERKKIKKKIDKNEEKTAKLIDSSRKNYATVYQKPVAKKGRYSRNDKEQKGVENLHMNRLIR